VSGGDPLGRRTPTVDDVVEVVCDDPGAPGAAATAALGSLAERAAAVELFDSAAAELRHLVRSGASVAAASGAEALVKLYARPPLLVERGSFVDPPSDWADLLEQRRGLLEQVIASVARVENAAVPNPTGEATAFMVAPGVALTNRHVAEGLTKGPAAGWEFLDGYRPVLNFAAHADDPAPVRLDVVSVLGVHADPALDVALLAVDGDGPAPVPLAAMPGGPSRWVCTVGHPKLDPLRNDAEQLERVFGGVFDVKRVSPGMTLDPLDVSSCKVAPSTVFHDCSTLGGSSGSCVVDLDLGAVVAVHYCGAYRVANCAAPLAELFEDPLFTSAGVTATS
jgi:endonuclease G